MDEEPAEVVLANTVDVHQSSFALPEADGLFSSESPSAMSSLFLDRSYSSERLFDGQVMFLLVCNHSVEY